MQYTESDIFSLLEKGESEVLEYKRYVSSTILAKLITAFAKVGGRK
jgi:hypothetical protein